jgi:hypothetical protein
MASRRPLTVGALFEITTAACIVVTAGSPVVAGSPVGAVGTETPSSTTDAAFGADPGPGDNVSIDGTVTGPDGEPATDAVVLVADSLPLTELSPSRLRTLAAADPPNLTVAAVDDDGSFDATAPWDHAEAVVAVSEAGTSDLRFARRENTTLSLQLYEHRPQTVHVHLGAVTYEERTAEMFVHLDNNDDATVRNLSVEIVSVPAGWSVAAVRNDGGVTETVGPTNRTLSWRAIRPTEEADTTVVLRVPTDASPGEYTVELRAESDSHRVSVEDETVEVLPEETAKPTTMPSPTVTPTATDTTPTEPAPTATDVTPTEPAPTEPTPTATDRTPTTADSTPVELSPTTTDATTPPPTTGQSPGFGLSTVAGTLVALALLVAARRQW